MYVRKLFLSYYTMYSMCKNTYVFLPTTGAVIMSRHIQILTLQNSPFEKKWLLSLLF